MEPLKEFSKIALSLENCIIPNERLLTTPSLKDGVSHELEVDLRITGCEYIQSAGLLLKLPQVAMATAQVLFQRFYYAKSLVKYGIQPMAMACIFVAAKIEEDCRRLRDVINVFHHLKQKRMGSWYVFGERKMCFKSTFHHFERLRKLAARNIGNSARIVPIVPMEYMGEEYFKLKSSVIKYERFLLKELGFCVHVKHPHKLIITYLQILEMEKNTPLAQRAWNFMNDCLRTNVFVRFSPETIACACIFLGARQLKIPLPQKPAWWTVFDTPTDSIEAISLEILALYERPRKPLEELEKEIGMLKAQLVKKQVEIKEVNLKKSPSGGETAAASSSTLTPVQRGTNGSATQSPINAHSSSVPPMQDSQSIDSSKMSRSQPVSPIRNGSQKVYQSLSPSPRKRRHSLSPPPRSNNDRSRSRSPHKRSASPKPISSPIKASSSSESLSEQSVSPLAQQSQENGLPEQYRQDYLHEHERRGHRSRHKHHSSHRHEHHARESSRDNDRHSSRHRHRHRERERRREYELEREMFGVGKKREREREYSREKGKMRRTDSRYR